MQKTMQDLQIQQQASQRDALEAQAAAAEAKLALHERATRESHIIDTRGLSKVEGIG